MVSGVTQLLDQSVWNPESFLKDFGDIKNDLINCLTGNTVPNQPMKKFWEGFFASQTATTIIGDLAIKNMIYSWFVAAKETVFHSQVFYSSLKTRLPVFFFATQRSRSRPAIFLIIDRGN